MLLRVRRQQSVVAKSSWLPAMRTCKRNGSYKSPHRMLSCCRLKECAVGYAEILLLSLRRHRSSSADHRWNDPMIKRILISLAITWVAATTLGIILGARVLGTASITNLWGAGVVQMAAMLCTGTALFLTPLTAWALKSYASIKWIFCLWLLLALWLLATPALIQSGQFIICGAFLLAVGGLIGIRLLARQ